MAILTVLRLEQTGDEGRLGSLPDQFFNLFGSAENGYHCRTESAIEKGFQEISTRLAQQTDQVLKSKITVAAATAVVTTATITATTAVKAAASTTAIGSSVG